MDILCMHTFFRNMSVRRELMCVFLQVCVQLFEKTECPHVVCPDRTVRRFQRQLITSFIYVCVSGH